METAIEAKSSDKITSDSLKGLRHLKFDHPNVKKRMIVCLEKKERRTEDDILILPYENFASRLWSGLIL